MRSRIVLSAVLLAAVCPLGAAAASGSEKPGEGFAGVWKGSSICQVKDSPCHDELAVYYVKPGDAAGGFEMSLNKVVGGEEELMGTLSCKPGQEALSFVCQQNALARWTWRLRGDSLSGTLLYRDVLYRRIELTRKK